MNELYTEINNRTNGKYADVRFPQIQFFSGGAVVTVVIAQNAIGSSDADRTEIKRLVNDICAFHVPADIKFVYEEITRKSLRDKVASFLGKFAFAASADISVDLDPARVILTMHKSMMKLAEESCLPRLKEYLKNNYIQPIAVVTEIIDYAEERRDVKQSAVVKKSYKVSDLAPIAGEIAAEEAISVANTEEISGEVTVCGVLTMLTDYVSKVKFGGGGNEYELFTLYDGEKTLVCRYYPKDGVVLSAHKKDIVNKPVCVKGYVKAGRFGESLLTADAIALCSAEGLTVYPAPVPPEKYESVAPAPYEEYVQASLFQTEVEPPDCLRGSFVVFDFETTGLSLEYDMPTEIGAVKITDGVITETFSTLIDPKRPIPTEVSAKTGITDEMVKGKPELYDVLPDLYKFTFGCSLVCHNVSFDFPFLLKHGNKSGWTFGDRRTYDTMGLAPRAIKGIEKLSLDKVLESLGLVNDNAHRALSDAAATAKAFIAMAKTVREI